jgi:stress response protein SCP2
MTPLTPGANCAAPVGPLTVSIASSAALDVSALLLAATGKVRSDADFIFYNAPTAPGVTFTPAERAPRGLDTVTIDPARVPAGIDKVVVTASLDGRGPTTFAAAGTVTATVTDASGGVVADFRLPSLTTETAVVCVEVYSRNGTWKIRAVGQGYANGLAGIARDFGITVDDDPAPTRTAPSPAAAPPAPAPVVAAPTLISLDKGKVTLTKGQVVSLTKRNAPSLSHVTMALGWDEVAQRGGGDIDLDASCIAYDQRGKEVDTIYFGSKSGCGDAVQHSGDNLTGAGDGDDETITVNLAAVPAKVTHLMFTVNSYSGQTFEQIRNAYCRLLDSTGRTPVELVRYELSDAKATTGVFMCRLTRGPGDTWTMTALGEFARGRIARDMVKPGEALLG